MDIETNQNDNIQVGTKIDASRYRASELVAAFLIALFYACAFTYILPGLPGYISKHNTNLAPVLIGLILAMLIVCVFSVTIYFRFVGVHMAARPFARMLGGFLTFFALFVLVSLIISAIIGFVVLTSRSFPSRVDKTLDLIGLIDGIYMLLVAPIIINIAFRYGHGLDGIWRSIAAGLRTHVLKYFAYVLVCIAWYVSASFAAYLGGSGLRGVLSILAFTVIGMGFIIAVRFIYMRPVRPKVR